ncbi:MAG TPA: hypothetical protein VLK65_14550 [Vicinamibacteria bacterium]|nr:hypothetical protein [Vicinamibacteria bacterium]
MDRKQFELASWQGLPFFGALILYALMVLRFDFVCDDAFISFRYARNFAHGAGLRYNLGVEPPVEGYSNFLWVLTMSLFEAVGADVAVASRLISVAFGASLLGMLMLFLYRRVHGSYWSAGMGAIFLASLPPFSVWSTGGLETVPFAFLLFATFERLLGDEHRPKGIQAGVLGLLCGLIRTDGAFYALLIIGLALLTGILTRRKETLRATAEAAAILIAGMTLYVAWRYSYYGDYVSNTARAKLSMSALSLQRGLRYAISFILTFPSIAFVILVSPWILRGERRRLAWHALGMVIGIFLASILVGGDFMSMGRLMVPALPFVTILFALVICTVLGQPITWARGMRAVGFTAAAIGLSILPAFNLHVVPKSARERFHFRWNTPHHVSEYEHWQEMKRNAVLWTMLGKALARYTHPGESLVFHGIGAVGYYSNLFIYDQYGLTSREVALRKVGETPASAGHEKRVEPAFFVKHEPTYLLANVVLLRGAAQVFVEEEIDVEGHRYRTRLIPLSPQDGFPENAGLYLVQRDE